jgi:hypothetical protein
MWPVICGGPMAPGKSPLGHPYTVVRADFWSRLTALRMSKLHCALRGFLRHLGGKSE